MLNKLLKYDLKYMIKNMSIFYILTIFFSIVIRIISLFNKTVMIIIIEKFSIGCLIAMIMNILINSIIRSWVRFKTSIYKDESYLTHTIPVEKKYIYESKFIQTFIFLILGFIIIVSSLFIAFYTKDNWALLKNTINGLSTNLNISVVPFAISLIIVFFMEIYNVVQIGFLGIIIGYKKLNNKLMNSVLYGFIIYTISQVIQLIILLLIGLFDRNILNLFTETTLINNEIITNLMIYAIGIYLFIIAIINIACVKYLNKGVDIE